MGVNEEICHVLVVYFKKLSVVNAIFLMVVHMHKMSIKQTSTTMHVLVTRRK